MSAAPLISVGLPVFNGEKYVAQAVESLLEQTLGDMEVIVSDNGSTDATQSICKSLASQDARVHYLRHDRNRGASWNINFVAKTARCPYFRWHMADDLVSPDLHERLYEALVNRPQAALVFPKTVNVDQEGNYLRDCGQDLDLRDPRPAARLRQGIKQIGHCNAAMGLLRTSTILQTKGEQPFLGADVVLLLELSLHGQLHRVEHGVYYRRIHEGSFSQMADNKERLSFYDPAKSQAIYLRKWVFYYQLLAAVARAPLAPRQRFAATAVVLRYALMSRRALGQETLSLIALYANAVFRGRNETAEHAP